MMAIRLINFSINRTNDEVTDDLFWHVMDIWWTKPHCVNKRICGADFPNGAMIDTLFDAEMELMKRIRPDQKFGDVELEIRRLLPKDLNYFQPCFEILVKDRHTPSAIFLPRSKSDSSSESDQSRSPHVNMAYGIALSKDDNGNGFLNLRMEDRPTGEAATKWLSETLMPTLVRWMNHCVADKPLAHSIRLVNLEAYNARYNRLKTKYGKHLVEVWPERTDPKKFVYEDVAVAAYLLTLWEEDRKEGRCNRMQTFVDLGCGNGLLVYLLASEQHPGYGIDIRRRNIWDIYGKDVKLLEQAFEPSDQHLFPDADWIIGNHSDELTPWIPVIAAKSSSTCNFLVIPCCAWDFKGKYQRKDADLSKYRSYLRYVRTVGEKCGFHCHDDILKIPSTKRACIVGRRNTDIHSDVVEKNIQMLIGQREPEAASMDQSHWTTGFQQREAKEPIRNCSTLPKTSIQAIVNKIAMALLNEKRFVAISDGRRWNAGGTLTIPECAQLLDDDDLHTMKAQCGGVQTLLRNHRQIFQVDQGGVSIRNWRELSASYGRNDKISCWFHSYHPDGCPLSAPQCPYSHNDG